MATPPPEPLDAAARSRRSPAGAWLLAGGAGLLALGLVAAALLPELAASMPSGASLAERVALLFARLEQSPPLVFFGAMAILCTGPVPVSLFYVSAGPLFGTAPALAWIAAALALNITLGHTAAGGLLRPAIEALLARRGLRIPRARNEGDERLLIVLVRITPGIPFFAQNLMLGVAGAGLLRTLVISLPIQMVFATGFVVLGRSAFEGDLGLAVLAIGLIVGGGIVARFVHRRLRDAGATDDPPIGESPEPQA